ncbi:unnamed protein product [Sordaria macrospora k-hell]|uniref:WGS project CABT00000000 data, contig 2.51 n=2 Tax=Sordaria macrospora TaxID=5147 RepID=F7W9F5_SORMK|nr:uncharacterized protein SMAC_09497 [Sordaria macrospora k-hell]CCC13946.1 unnamed protein product [Sordaria macrospora k-hell]
MKFTTALTLLFATVALAAPAAEPNPESALEARGSCGISCACQGGRCNCANCNQMGCNWFFNGKTC